MRAFAVAAIRGTVFGAGASVLTRFADVVSAAIDI
jgi:hypothetical protein